MAGILLMIGYLLMFVGSIWMVVTAIQTGKDTADKAIWGLVTFFLCALGGVIFYIVKKQGRTPLMVQIAGFVITIIAVVVGGGSASFGTMPQ